VVATIVACHELLPAQRDPTPSPSEQAYARLPGPIPASCGVTPATYGTDQGFPAFWYVGEGLRAGTPIGVFYQGLNKVQWHGDDLDLKVTGSRVDGTNGEPALVNPQRIGAGMLSTSVEFPAPGCWRIHATLGRGRLDAIVYVFPDSERRP
jgi:hypothetical protein